MIKLICHFFGHKLMRVNCSPNGELDKLLCSRCGVFYAMFHPQKYFGVWDHEDQDVMDMWKKDNIGSNAKQNKEPTKVMALVDVREDW